jgi:uncharacterized protein (DUF1778 family)
MDYQRIEFRVTPEQGSIIAAAAESKGLAVATWLRMVALEAARNETAKSATPVTRKG